MWLQRPFHCFGLVDHLSVVSLDTSPGRSPSSSSGKNPVSNMSIDLPKSSRATTKPRSKFLYTHFQLFLQTFQEIPPDISLQPSSPPVLTVSIPDRISVANTLVVFGNNWLDDSFNLDDQLLADFCVTGSLEIRLYQIMP